MTIFGIGFRYNKSKSDSSANAEDRPIQKRKPLEKVNQKDKANSPKSRPSRFALVKGSGLVLTFHLTL